MKVTPFGSSCLYEIVNETTALAPFLGHHSMTEQNLSARSIETEILVRVGETVYAMSMDLWRREDGLPVQVKAWAAKAIVLIAYSQILIGAFKEVFDIEYLPHLYSGGYFDEGRELDTGFYVVGRLMARFVIRIVWEHAPANDPLTLMLNICVQIVAMLLKSLQEMGAEDNTWAMEGKVYGPGNATGGVNSKEDEEKRGKEVVAKWQIWMGNYGGYDR